MLLFVTAIHLTQIGWTTRIMAIDITNQMNVDVPIVSKTCTVAHHLFDLTDLGQISLHRRFCTSLFDSEWSKHDVSICCRNCSTPQSPGEILQHPRGLNHLNPFALLLLVDGDAVYFRAGTRTACPRAESSH